VRQFTHQGIAVVLEARLTLAIDCSNYSGAISIQQAHNLYSDGVRKAIVQVVNPSVLTHRQQIPNLLAAKIEVEAYVYVWFSAGEAFCYNRAVWACNELVQYAEVRKVWLDCEQSDHDTPPFDYVHAAVSPSIRQSVQAVRDRVFVPGIYTAAWWWIPGASNSQEWKDLDLWDANYDLDPDLDPVDYGGWTVPRMTQYQANTTLAGVPMLDLNAYVGTVEPAPPAVPVAEINAKLTDARQLIMDAYTLLNP
jgi:hypothetical protein